MVTREIVSEPLAGWTVTTDEGAALPIRVCAEHLAFLGARWDRERPRSPNASTDALVAGEFTLRPESGGGKGASLDEGLDCTIQWQGVGQRDAKLRSTEAIVQAISGLMGVHGRDGRIPQRLGLEVASVAAGIVATQGVLAALIARSRGYSARRVQTSVLQAGLLFLSHHLAIATCADGFSFPSLENGAGPPFRTADDEWIEIEVLSFDTWLAFWRRLGVKRAGLEVAWSSFVYRYLAASCALPAALHQATARHSLAELRRIAGACGIALCRVRTYPEVLAELGWPAEVGGQSASSDLGLKAPWAIYVADQRPTTNDQRPTTDQGRRSPCHLVTLSEQSPLAGLRVVEITSRLQGPLAGLLLRMLGADVLKVEPPGGDFGRHAPPLAGSFGAAYLAYNRGKRVVEIDYKGPAGRAQLADLLATADVFLHNWRSGRAEKLGLDFADVARSNPGLVYAHASGWGRDGDEPCPFAGDYLVQAHAGSGDGLNPSDKPPFPSRLTLVDVTGGLLACEGILAGLYLRERTGQGCRADTSLLAGAMALQTSVLQAIADGHEQGRYLGRPLWGILDRPIETADGFLVVSAEDEQTRRRLSEVCGLGSSTDAEASEEAIAERLRSRPAAEWEVLLLDAGIPAAAVNSDLNTLPRDSRVAALLERVEDACWVPGAPWQIAS